MSVLCACECRSCVCHSGYGSRRAMLKNQLSFYHDSEVELSGQASRTSTFSCSATVSVLLLNFSGTSEPVSTVAGLLHISTVPPIVNRHASIPRSHPACVLCFRNHTPLTEVGCQMKPTQKTDATFLSFVERKRHTV